MFYKEIIMKKSLLYFAITSFYLLTTAAFATESDDKSYSENQLTNTISMQGFTGVFNTPNSSVVNYGDFNFSYSDNFYDQGNLKNTKNGFESATDLKFGIGLLPGLEVVGRLGTQTWNCNHFFEKDCGFRDLSGSVKYQIPFIPEDWFELAIGGQDVGGSVVKSEAYYGVASKTFNFDELGNVRVSLGYSTSDNALNYMNGGFGSVEYQPSELIQVAAEYDANAVNVGVKFFAPKKWLPTGWRVSAGAQLYSSESEHNEKSNWFSVDLNIPLGTTSPRPSSQTIANRSIKLASAAKAKAKTQASKPSSSIAPESVISENLSTVASEKQLSRNNHIKPTDINNKVNLESIEKFARYVTDYGFESVSIGLNKAENGLIVEFENNLYNRNEDDAINVMARLISQKLPINTELNLLNYGLVVQTVNLEFTENSVLDVKSNETISSENYLLNLLPGNSNKWLVNNAASAYFTPRITLAPATSTLVGTEYGALDYQVIASVNPQISIWPGAVIDIRYMSNTLLASDDFDDNEFIKNRFSIIKGIDRRLIHQTFALPLNIFTQFSFGRIYGNADGLLNETRYVTDNGNHRFSLLLGDFDDKQIGRRPQVSHQPKLVKYRFRYRPLNWDMEVTAGEYWQGDKGFTLKSSHWFGNAQINVQYKRTKFDEIDGGEEEDFFAIGFSIPLNFGKSMNSKYGFQIKGIEQWNYSVQTSLTDKNTGNSIKTGFGIEPALYHNLNQAYFNRDRF
jgi:hypothetical protein